MNKHTNLLFAIALLTSMPAMAVFSAIGLVSREYWRNRRAANERMLDQQEQMDEEANRLNQCSICLNRIAPSRQQTLACGHSFHHNCIENWLNQRRSCPLCRHEISILDENERDRQNDLNELLANRNIILAASATYFGIIIMAAAFVYLLPKG